MNITNSEYPECGRKDRGLTSINLFYKIHQYIFMIQLLIIIETDISDIF